MSLSLFTKSAFAVKSANPMRSVVAATFHTSSFSAQATPVWTVDSVRTGVIAKKKGMTSIWTEAGVRLPVTVLQVRNK